MTRDEYAEMVDYLTDRYGIAAMDSWAAAARIYPDFESFDTDEVWAALLVKLDADPKTEWPPKPPALRAAIIDRRRHRPPHSQLPETTTPTTWREYSERTYGRHVPLAEAARTRARELDVEYARSHDGYSRMQHAKRVAGLDPGPPLYPIGDET